MALILLVEDEKLLRWSLEQRLTKVGHTVHTAETLEVAEQHLRDHRPELLLLDLSLPDGHGLDFYEQNAGRLEETAVLVMTAVGQVEDAVRAMKLGAEDFLTKPIDHEELVAVVRKSLETRSIQLEAEVAKGSRRRRLNINLIAHSPAFRETLEIAAKVAKSEISSVLVQGESGTGKNVLSRYIHSVSERRERPFLDVNCAAIPDQLLESELFGHERGAFTDAKQTKKGAFELANGGTVVLDEIAELKLELQSKLLQFLEDRRFRRVGGVREIQVDVRIVALTNRDLKQRVADGRFRNDLYFRLSGFPITVPPLRERSEDVLPLAELFLSQLQRKLDRRHEGFSREAENSLLSYSWPGNVRELRNVVERATILELDSQITGGSLILEGVGATPAPEEGDVAAGLPEGIVALEEVEREMVRRALAAVGDNQTRAAELLGVSRDQLRYRIKKYGW